MTPAIRNPRCSRFPPQLRGKEIAMSLLSEAINFIGAVLLQIAVGLLIEELTFAGLVRLLIAPRPAFRKNKGRSNEDKGENQ
jgi:hypothetical protein